MFLHVYTGYHDMYSFYRFIHDYHFNVQSPRLFTSGLYSRILNFSPFCGEDESSFPTDGAVTIVLSVLLILVIAIMILIVAIICLVHRKKREKPCQIQLEHEHKQHLRNWICYEIECSIWC